MTSPNTNWPLNITSVDFVTDPFNAGIVENWVDISARVQSFDSSVGKQYELDTGQAGEATYTLYDPDEALNPTNATSVYAPNVTVYRQITDQAMWPNQTTGNLLNSAYGTDSRLGTGSTGYDPSFESYTAGQTVSWVQTGTVSPTVTTTTPFQGTKCLTYALVGGTSGREGINIVVPTIPNQQYTDSIYVNQSSSNTQRIMINGIAGATDAFSRTVSGGWSSADSGGAYTLVGGLASDYSVSNGIGTMSLNAVNTPHLASLRSDVIDIDAYVTVTVPVVATGSYISAGILHRYQDANNYYSLGARFNTDGSISAYLEKNVAGTITSLGNQTVVGLTYSAGTQVNIRATTVGTGLIVKVWAFGTPEPPSQVAFILQNIDTSFLNAGATGLRANLSTGNTNTLPVPVSFDNFRASTNLVGTSTTTVGSYVRLTITYTATTTTQTLNLNTIGAVTAGNVFVDAIQHEQGATANTFTTSGPTIYGIFSGFVERWPSSWTYQGTYGMAQITCVDAFAPMAGQFLDTELRNSILSYQPDYYWTLGEGSGATSFADTSGNLGPPIQFVKSPWGAGTLPAAGTSLNIVGDPSGTGVKITADPVNQLNEQTTILGVGNGGTSLAGLLSSPPILWPKTVTQPYGASLVMWVNNALPTNGGTLQYFFLSAFGSINTGGGATVGIIGNTSATLASNVQNSLTTQIGLTLSSVGGTDTANLYVNGALAATGSGASAPKQVTSIFALIGGWVTSNISDLVMNGSVAHIALWSRALSSEIADMYTAGNTGYSGERSDQRFNRYMGYQFVAPSNTETGMSTMGTSTLTQNTALLDAVQSVTTTENGILYVDANGIAQFQSRSHRYLETSAKWVFGENQAGGEIPYLGDLVFDFDPTQVYNDVQVTNSGGLIATGGAVPDITASRLKYGKRSYNRTINVASNNEAQDAANWIFYGHASPTQRVEQITVDVAANPALFAKVFGIRISDRATVNRRTTAFTQTADYYIERIEHSRGPGKWQVIFQMSPVLNRQPWILGDATYGVLGTTTILGY